MMRPGENSLSIGCEMMHGGLQLCMMSYVSRHLL